MIVLHAILWFLVWLGILILATLSLIPALFSIKKAWYLARYASESALPIITALAAMAGSRALAISGGAAMIAIGICYSVTTVLKTIEKTKLRNEQYFNSQTCKNIISRYRIRNMLALCLRWAGGYVSLGTMICILAVLNECVIAGWLAVAATGYDLLINLVFIKLLCDKLGKCNYINHLIVAKEFNALQMITNIEAAFEKKNNPADSPYDWRQVLNEFWRQMTEHWYFKLFGIPGNVWSWCRDGKKPPEPAVPEPPVSESGPKE